MADADPEAHTDPRWVSEALEARAYLGGGATSRVYGGYDHRTQREVAIKVARVDLDLRGRQRLAREVSALSAVRHPGVVSVLGHGALHDGRPYVVMERIHGRSVLDAMRASPDGRMDFTVAVPLAIELLQTLSMLHHAGIVHRDVKPANVLITPERLPVLVDFGFARLSDGGPRLTPDGRIVGTPGYIPPEVLFGVEASPTADVYATGVMLFEMMAGEPPFKGELSKMIVAIMRGPRPDLRARVPDVPLSIATIVVNAMAREPTARPSALVMADALRAALEGR